MAAWAARWPRWWSPTTRCRCASSACRACSRRPARRTWLLEHFGLDRAGHLRRRARAGRPAPARQGMTVMAAHSELILAIDQGTTNTKVLLVDANGAIVAQASRPLDAALSPARLGRAGRRRDLAERARGDRRVPRGVRRAACWRRSRSPTSASRSPLWERDSGRPLGPVIVWQCRRTAEFCAELRARGLAADAGSSAPGWPSIRCSRPARCAGCSSTSTMGSAGPSAASCAWARSIAGCCGT